MSVIDVLCGRPLPSSEEQGERLGPLAGVPVFGLDALSSAAYGPEAALALLLALGAMGVRYIVPITTSIIALLLIVYFSYRQTIAAYPQGGGSYTVAGKNLGSFAGLLAAAALMIDYVLTAAVGISAGVGALISAVPSLQAHTLGLCLAILVLLVAVNLRGARETGVAFMMPTYLFLATLLTTIVVGGVKSIGASGHPMPVVAPAPLHSATVMVSAWLILKAFASGCTAMTGVEAVSNGVTAFREPVVKSAQRTLTIVIAFLIVLLAGIAYLCRAYQIGASEPGPGYQSVLSQLIAAVAGKNAFYYVSIAAILLVLSLSANTAFADFPRLCRLIAEDGYLPNPLAVRGRRLVYTMGIAVLAVFSGALLILFQGVTDRLIPLYAVGAFLAFTLSQAGMVAHWKRTGGPGSRIAMLVNGLGAIATGATVIIVTVTKFRSGAWITTLLIPAILLLMYSIHRHYDKISAQIADAPPIDAGEIGKPVVVMPIFHWNKVARMGVEMALALSPEVYLLHVETHGERLEFTERWNELIAEPARRAGLATPQLIVIDSPYRFVITPIVEHVLNLHETMPQRQIAVIIPELVEKHWYQYFLHNQRAKWLKAALLLKGNSKIMVISVPWYLRS